MDPETLVRRNDRAAYRELEQGEGAVVLHLDTADYHGLNETGVLVWRLLEHERRFDDLVARVREAFEDPPHSLDEDLAGFLEALDERRLVSLEPPSD